MTATIATPVEMALLEDAADEVETPAAATADAAPADASPPANDGFVYIRRLTSGGAESAIDAVLADEDDWQPALRTAASDHGIADQRRGRLRDSQENPRSVVQVVRRRMDDASDDVDATVGWRERWRRLRAR